MVGCWMEHLQSGISLNVQDVGSWSMWNVNYMYYGREPLPVTLCFPDNKQASRSLKPSPFLFAHFEWSKTGGSEEWDAQKLQALLNHWYSPVITCISQYLNHLQWWYDTQKNGIIIVHYYMYLWPFHLLQLIYVSLYRQKILRDKWKSCNHGEKTVRDITKQTGASSSHIMVTKFHSLDFVYCTMPLSQEWFSAQYTGFQGSSRIHRRKLDRHPGLKLKPILWLLCTHGSTPLHTPMETAFCEFAIQAGVCAVLDSELGSFGKAPPTGSFGKAPPTGSFGKAPPTGSSCCQTLTVWPETCTYYHKRYQGSCQISYPRSLAYQSNHYGWPAVL